MNRFLGILRLHPTQLIPDAWKWSVAYDGRRHFPVLVHDNGFQVPASTDRREKVQDVAQLGRILAVRMKRSIRLACSIQEAEARRIGGGA